MFLPEEFRILLIEILVVGSKYAVARLPSLLAISHAGAYMNGHMVGSSASQGDFCAKEIDFVP